MTLGQRRGGCALLALLAVRAATASAHWLRPDEIVAGLANDVQLRERFGVARVQNDPKLPRLLIVSVRPDVWETVPASDRVRLAEEWLETWRHNVPDGIVAVLDVQTEQSLVHFDPFGHALLRTASPAVTPLPPAGPHTP